MKNWIELLKKELSKPLPGAETQFKMASSLRRLATNDKPYKSGSVMILVYLYQGFLYTVFIKRSEYEGVHSGQISFPGGMSEESDDSWEYTASRETGEETGIPVSVISVIGQLTPLHIPVSNVHVYPVVGIIESRPDFIPDPDEVQYLIETRLEDLINPSNRKIKLMKIAGQAIEVPYFDIQDNHIWGATAMILSEFLEVVKRAKIGLRFEG